jgi:hypothetical protein
MLNKLVLETDGLQVGTNQLVAQAGSITIGRDLLVGGGIKTATTGNPLSFSTSNGEQLRIVNLQNNTTTVNRYVEISGGVQGLSGPGIGVGGGGEVFDIYSSGNSIWFSTGGNKRVAGQAEVRPGGDGTNYLSFTGGTNGNPVQINAFGGNTNISIVLSPKGSGSLQAQAADNGIAGGNARGTNSVDWQTLRSIATQVASGPYSAILGGTRNTASSSGSFVGGGYNNSNSGYESVICGGSTNNNNGFQSVIVGGTNHSVTGTLAVIVGGTSNQALGFFNFIGGGQSNSATSNSAVTTQDGTMNGTTAVTLSGSNANIRVGQYISGTSITTNTYVAAISGTSLTLSQIASGSSTSTLSFFTPHGVVVGGGNNQATGSYSFIGGGGDAGTAANRNVASGDWSVVVGGRGNIASGIGSFVGGGGIQTNFSTANTASGESSFIGGGLGNFASNSGASVAGGYQNIADGTMSSVVGGRRGTTRGIIGNIISPACNIPIFDAVGVSQSALLVIGRQTTDATPTVLTSDSNAASTTNQVILPNNSAYFFTGEVVAGVTGGGNTKGWTIEGVIKRGSGVGTTAIVGTATVTSSYADAGASAWTIAVTADTTNGGLRVTFTGQAGTTIRCVAQIRTTEMTY